MRVLGAALLVAAPLGLLSACASTQSRGARPREAAAPRAGPPTLLQQGLDAYDRGDFARAAAFFERERARSPASLEAQYQLARAWVHVDRALEAEDLIGDLLMTASDTLRPRIQAEPAFDAPGFAELLRTGGASALPPEDGLRTQFDVDGNGEDETFLVSRRTTRNQVFLAVIAHTAGRPVARRLVELTAAASRLTAFRTGTRGCVLLLEGAGGHYVEAELHLISGVPPASASVVYSRRYVLDAGDVDDPPPVDGALWFSVLDVVAGGEPEVVFTFVDPQGEPRSTTVLDINHGLARELGPATSLRAAAASRLRAGQRSLSRHLAEAWVRLEPDSVPARLALLGAVDVSTSSEWWGFYPPGSNAFVALHGAYAARHSTSQVRATLAAVPAVSDFLARWSLTAAELGVESEPLVPPSGLWGRAHFLGSPDVSTSFSYFRLVP